MLVGAGRHEELEPILTLMYFGQALVNEVVVGRVLEILKQLEIKSPMKGDEVDTANRIADFHVKNLQENIDDTSDKEKKRNKNISMKSTQQPFEIKKM